jgi:hypothetical protein
MLSPAAAMRDPIVVMPGLDPSINRGMVRL